MAPSATEVRFAERLLGWLDANLSALPPESAIRFVAEDAASDLAIRCGLPRIGTRPLANLQDAAIELRARLDEADALPFESLSSDQWRIVGAGIPLSIEEVRDGSDDSAAEWLHYLDERPRAALASAFHACGVLKGALVQAWRR